VLVQPLVLAGKGIRPGAYGDIKQVDIAPTLAALLGAAVPSSSQGQVRTEMMDLPAESFGHLPGYIDSQLVGVVKAYSKAILGREPDFPPVELTAAAANEMTSAIRFTKLGPERSLRSVFALILVVIPLVVIILKWRKEFSWYLIGGFFLLFLFNLRYAWIDSRTYSLSSVQSEMDMILYVGTTAAFAYAISWLGVMLVTKSFKKGALAAASDSILFTQFCLFILYSLALVNFGYNGWKVTWTLPDFLLQYLGLMAVIIAIFTAVAGLILTGIAAITGKLIRNR
jgi:hypothetical protein